ncbi:hypothetical protein BVC80_9101g196 [Macleaya cordata]|uniref:Uncharacterized protein n=1 Tax=Macleaya cordata TaxID=56857 RepID=A0A200QGW7_MACCD|nr:hypothetical protein BVC80_9101g196 [Macleaya cordata]
MCDPELMSSRYVSFPVYGCARKEIHQGCYSSRTWLKTRVLSSRIYIDLFIANKPENWYTMHSYKVGCIPLPEFKEQNEV